MTALSTWLLCWFLKAVKIRNVHAWIDVRIGAAASPGLRPEANLVVNAAAGYLQCSHSTPQL